MITLCVHDRFQYQLCSVTGKPLGGLTVLLLLSFSFGHSFKNHLSLEIMSYVQTQLSAHLTAIDCINAFSEILCPHYGKLVTFCELLSHLR